MNLSFRKLVLEVIDPYRILGLQELLRIQVVVVEWDDSVKITLNINLGITEKTVTASYTGFVFRYIIELSKPI